jgi:hypothetical protein
VSGIYKDLKIQKMSKDYEQTFHVREYTEYRFQIKITRRNLCPHIRMTELKISNDTKCWQECRDTCGWVQKFQSLDPPLLSRFCDKMSLFLCCKCFHINQTHNTLSC